MIKVVACKIFEYYLNKLEISFDNYEFVFLDIQQHNQPHQLAKNIQKEIDQSTDYEKIILLYGLCGNALLEVRANQIPLYLVRVHDCLSILLGSKTRFNELFNDRLSSSWSCYSLKVNGCNVYNDEQYLKWCNDYDQETADYLMSVLNNQNDIYLTYNEADDSQYINNQELIAIDLQFLQDILMFKSSEIIKLNPNQKIIISSEINQVFAIKEENSND